MNKLPLEKRYRPSNGSAGDSFMSKYCTNCIVNHEECEVVLNSMLFDKNEDGYP